MPRRAALFALALAACGKVPVSEVDAAFTIADATWFAEEGTVFLFYRIDADQGLGKDSVIEVSWRTATEEVPWTDLSTLPMVHAHVPADCGLYTRCGSASLSVLSYPQSFDVRLRWHRDGEISLLPDKNYQLTTVWGGDPDKARSLLVYGVFDESNRRVQWRARHQFPSLRNMEVEALGLRRWFQISEQAAGWEDARPVGKNPYAYGFDSCPSGSGTDLGWESVSTTERAVFDPAALELPQDAASRVCALSTVTDAHGTFEAPVVALKNPDTKGDLPVLHSPIRKNRHLEFLLRPCTRTISAEHLAMQKQRLLLRNPIEICIDGWRSATFTRDFTARMNLEIDDARTGGEDMMLTLAIHHDDTSGQLAMKVEAALLDAMALERTRSSPRVSGAFLLDSYGHQVVSRSLAPLVSWCPGAVTDEDAPFLSQCPVQPDGVVIPLDPFMLGVIPIMPSRDAYLFFIDQFSKAQAGEMNSLDFLAPVRTPLSVDIEEEVGRTTFFNNEAISVEPGDVFSFCWTPDSDAEHVRFLHDGAEAPLRLEAFTQALRHHPQTRYPVGLHWDVPFMALLSYDMVIAGSVTAFSFTIPFGVPVGQTGSYGSRVWTRENFSIAETLKRCVRFCQHPTFSSSGQYDVMLPFDTEYEARCYRPRFPVPSDGGFPSDE